MPQAKHTEKVREKVRVSSFKIAAIAAAQPTRNVGALASTVTLEAIRRIGSLVDDVHFQKAAVQTLAERLAFLEKTLGQLPAPTLQVDAELPQAIQRALGVVQRCRNFSSRGVLYKVLHKTRLTTELAAVNEELYRSAREIRAEASDLSTADSALTQQQPQRQLSSDSNSAVTQHRPECQLSNDCRVALQSFASPLPVSGEGEGSGEEEERQRCSQLESSVPLWSYKWGLLEHSQVVEELCKNKLVTLKELQDLKTDLLSERKSGGQPEDATTTTTTVATTESPQQVEDREALLVQTERVIAQLEEEEKQKALGQMEGESAELAVEEGSGAELAPREHGSAELAGEGQPRTVIVPASFLCPITKELMWDPVVLVASQQTYERRNILKWLSNNKRRDFVTGQTVPSPSATGEDFLLPNEALRHTIGVMLAPQEPFCGLPKEEWRGANVRFEYEFGGAREEETARAEELEVVPAKSGNLLRRIAMGDHTPLPSGLSEAANRWWGSNASKQQRGGGRPRSSSVPRMHHRTALESSVWLASMDDTRPTKPIGESSRWLDANDNGSELLRRSGKLALGKSCGRSVHEPVSDVGMGTAAWLRRKVRARFSQGSTTGTFAEKRCDKLSVVHHSSFSEPSAWLQRKVGVRKSGALFV